MIAYIINRGKGGRMMRKKLCGSPYENIKKMEELFSGKRISVAGSSTDGFWGTQYPTNIFKSSPDSRKNLIYRTIK